MNAADPAIADLVAGAGAPRRTVKQRLDRRLEVLREWLVKGIPFGKVIPKDLKAARVWDDEDLGVLKISSPNEFTSTHVFHGADVREIAGLLTKLQKKFGKPASRAKPASSATAATFDRQAFDAQLKAAVSQWHSQRDGRLSEERRRQAAEARSMMVNEEIKQKDELIADLRRQLSDQGSLRSVK